MKQEKLVPKRHMIQISHEAYEILRVKAFKNHRKMNAEIDILLGVKK